MCGIAGIIQTSNKLDIAQLQRMTDALAHRGPESGSVWSSSNNKCLLGHRRLSIIDLSEQAAQPMHVTLKTGQLSIVHNGEIYNYIELRQRLIAHGYQFKTQSDTEVILAAYDFWGEECVDHFDGMFAFAIWDENNQELFAARDRFGEKPFYYYHQDGIFQFASEMKALWSAAVPRVANLRMLFNFISIGYTDNPEQPEETFYENIFQLPAASFLFYTPADNKMVVEKYWELDLEKENKLITDNEAIENFAFLFSNSVKKRLRSDVPSGTSLSGGLDSSSIAAMIYELTNGVANRQSFTAIFPGYEKDESDYANEVARKFQLRENLSIVSAGDFAAEATKFFEHQEEPVGSASAFVQYKVYEQAKQQNIKVLLDGQGADELLAGYHKYYKWFWQELFIKRRLTSSGEIAAARRLGVKEEFGVKNIIAALFPDMASSILEKQYLLHALEQDDLAPDFVKLQSREAYYTTPELRGLNGALHFNLITHGLGELLRYADRNSMAHGVEVRLPFLSAELVEFVFSLPAKYKIRNGWTKWILRKSMNEKLPERICWRKDKTGFEPPQLSWMQDHNIREMIQAGKSKLVKENILKATVLNREVKATNAYDKENFDWRYLAASFYL